VVARHSRRNAIAVVVSIVAVLVLVVGGLRTWSPWTKSGDSNSSQSQTVARKWDEALLDAIRRALPNPPVHARNPPAGVPAASVSGPAAAGTTTAAGRSRASASAALRPRHPAATLAAARLVTKVMRAHRDTGAMAPL